jgi:hypothetical protein
VTRHDCIYSPYSDCGIFGHYLFGNAGSSRQLNLCGQRLHDTFAHAPISELEVTRAKQRLFMELATIETSTDVL